LVTHFKFKIMKKFYILLIFSLVFTAAFGQNLQLKGTVTDNNGVPLPGVNILVEHSKIGTVSNTSGRYTINVPNLNVTLVFSFVGFVPRTIQANGRTEISVSLTEDAQSLEEVVLVGYGSAQTKASIVGAISNINMKELRKAAPSNLSNAIGGRVPGLITRMGDGAVGGTQNRYSNGDLDDAQIYIRGKSTLNAQGALVLVDGVESSMSRINPEDIEQFSVLKDASATAVYGVRGANGVILITTRRGVAGPAKISATSQLRMMKPMDFPEVLGSYDHAMLKNEATKNAGGTTMPFSAEALEAYRTGSDPYRYPDIDWYDLLVKDYFTEQQHVANITGGTERVKYYIGGEYNQSGGIFVGSKENNSDYNYRRYNLRSNLDFAITKTTDLSVKVNGRLNDLNFSTKGENSGQRVNATAWGDITNRLPMDGQLYNPDGSYGSGNLAAGWNSLAEFYEGGYIRRLSSTLESNFTVNQKLDFITKGLALRALYGLTFGSGSSKQLNRSANIYTYTPSTGTYALAQAGINPYYSAAGAAFQDFARVQQIEAGLYYNKIFARNHAITAMGTFIQTTNESQINLPRYLGGLAGRVTYAYKNKYLAEGNLGYNGSDAFDKAKRYAFFPAGAIGWIASEEKFFKDNIKFVDFLKFRASYGEIGNERLSGSLQYFYQYNFIAPGTAPAQSNNVNGYYNLGTGAGVQQVGLQEGTLANNQVTWETARKTDIGMELKLFKSRVSFTGDVFLEKRNDILRQRADYPIYAGLTATRNAGSHIPATNIGKVTNKGIELSLSYTDHIGGFGFTVGGNYTFVRNKIDYMGEVLQQYAYQAQTGKPILTPLLYIWSGEFYTEADLTNPTVAKPNGTLYAGELKMKDLNGDLIINADDMARTGFTETPEKTFGLNLDMDYKNFYVSTFWQGASNVGLTVGGPLRNEFSPNIQRYQMEDRWVYDPSRGLDTRENAKYPLLIVGGAPQTQLASTFHQKNAEYLRLKAAEFGYIFPKSITQRLRVSALRVFLSGSNLLTFSHVKRYSLDPEYLGATNPGLDATNGIGTGAYSPQNKFYAVGLNVTF
jgi:TonB-linked SusC/RagA family outer membrane protein